MDVYKNDVTLPLLYLFQNSSSDRRQELLETIRSGARNGALDAIKTLARQTGAIDQAMGKARLFIDVAVESPKSLEAGPSRDSLENLAAFCLERAR